MVMNSTVLRYLRRTLINFNYFSCLGRDAFVRRDGSELIFNLKITVEKITVEKPFKLRFVQAK